MQHVFAVLSGLSALTGQSLPNLRLCVVCAFL
jgi:hypothetical protein